MNEGKPAIQGRFELLPAIDLHAGAVVRLVRGDFREVTAYPGKPEAVAADFVRSGARWLHVVDLDGARDPSTRQVERLRAIVAEVGESARVEVAGGLRDGDSVAAILDAGAARVVVGTAALQDAAFVRRLVACHGRERVAVALDVRERLAIGHGWVPGSAGVPVEEAVTALADAGVETFEVTAIDRDGTMAGPDLALLGRVVAMGRGAIIASAGIATTNDLRAVRALGCAGAIVGRALYEGRFTLEEALRSLEA